MLVKLRVIALIAVGSFAMVLSSCKTCDLTKSCATGDDECHRNAKICHHPTMHALAGDLDYLEEHIDKYGSVVAMQPAVWGQARLTRYREEFEKEMFKDFTTFAPTLQGSLSRSDQAYLASATAISAAISGPPAPSNAPTISQVQASTANADVFSAFNPSTPGGLTRTAIVGTDKDRFGFKGPISLEPTTLLDQKARYLNHLNQIRRNNEGDDTADSPGYSLNLVRVPVSVLPGKCTMKGYGAEITMTLKPYISEELLPATFRQLVVNDIVDMLALPLAQMSDEVDARVKSSRTGEKDKAMTIGQIYDSMAQDKEGEAMKRFMKGASRQRVASHPLPPSQIIPVLGIKSLTRIGKQVHTVVDSHQDARKSVYILDARATLRDEVEAAYEMLAQPRNIELWTKHCTAELAHAVRSRQDGVTFKLRTDFLDPLTQNITADLAWAIIVEAALLNEKLKQDIRQAAANTGRPMPIADGMQFFLPGPILSPEVRHTFNEYVRARWPIHVFTVDPVSQDQNIADTYSKRQEMQLALTLAFASGNMSASNMTRYARRIEKDMETIAINRTQIGFSHGEDTFGWRFYPRYQTPEIESNFKTIFRDQLIGGPSKNAEIRQTRLEPGMRECVAIVLMPSFVPYVTCEASSNWFKLTNPKCKEFTLTDAVRLGKVVKSVQTCSPNIKNANCYRDGDLARLLAKAKQLEARLPLQNMMVQVPYENTLGGFQMFNTGIADLAPELIGWYGGPGIQKDADTQLFLVGDHFSIHHTKVTAGGQNADFELISRQIMRVIIPDGVNVNTRKENTGKPINYVDVHVATPYGVTSHLEIPIIETTVGGPAAKKVALAFKQERVAVSFEFKPTGIGSPATPAATPLEILWESRRPAPTGNLTCELTLTVAKWSSDARPNDRSVSIKIPISGAKFTNGLLTVPDGDLAAKVINGFASLYGKNNPPVSMQVSKAVLVTLNGDGTTDSATLRSPLTIDWNDLTPKAAIPAPNQPALVGPTFGRPMPATISNETRPASPAITRRPAP